MARRLAVDPTRAAYGPDRTQPEQALWTAVLCLAFDDAVGRSSEHRQSALRFIESRWFESVLELAGLNCDLAPALRDAVTMDPAA